MSITAAELIPYASGTTATTPIAAGTSPVGPVTDTTTSGGAINPLFRVIFTEIGATTTVTVVLTAGVEALPVNIIGRNAAGSVVSEQVTTNGTTPVTSANSYAHIESVCFANTLPASATLNVGYTGGGATAIGTIVSPERGFIRLFRSATIPASSTTNRYEKFFWKNTDGSLALQAASVAITQDAQSTITFALETTVGSSQSVANRVTLPTISGAFGTGTITLLTATGTADLGSGLAIGVWALQALPSTATAYFTTFTSTLAGNSA